mgnify:FL=1
MFAKRETHSAHIGNGKIRNPKTNTSKGQPSRMMVHAKLEMTEPSDNEEREADLMADAIVSGGKISRAVEGNASQGGVAVPKGMENQLNQCQGGGRAMPDGLRSMMETGFGQDFSTVRLHTDNQAAEMSSAIHARAFTYGNNIFFNQGQYSPDTPAGQRLIAHELTHVVQGERKVARKVNEKICENIDLIDEEQVAWSKSLSNGLSGFNADNVAMLHLIETLRSKIIIILNQKKAILKISESAIMPSDLDLPDVSLKDIEDIEEARASIFNNVKTAIENSKKGKAKAKNALKDAISEFQAMGEVLTILSNNYDEIITNLYQLKANLEEELKKAATKLYFEIIDRRNLIKVKFQKVQYGWELLRETKDNAYWYVRWTAAPSDSTLDNIKSSINNVANGANAIESFYTRYKDKIDESKGSGLIIQFESFKELSEWAKFFNDKANEVGPKLYEIDCKISDLRNDSISSAENWVTGLKITSEICIAVSSSVIPGAGAVKIAARLGQINKIARIGRVIQTIANTNKFAQLASNVILETGFSVAGTGIEHGLKYVSNELAFEKVHKLPEGKDYGKSALSGGFAGGMSNLFSLAAKEKIGGIGKLADKVLSFSVQKKGLGISGEGLANSFISFATDKATESLIDGKTSLSAWDFVYALGGFKIKTADKNNSLSDLYEGAKNQLVYKNNIKTDKAEIIKSKSDVKTLSDSAVNKLKADNKIDNKTINEYKKTIKSNEKEIAKLDRDIENLKSRLYPEENINRDINTSTRLKASIEESNQVVTKDYGPKLEQFKEELPGVQENFDKMSKEIKDLQKDLFILLNSRSSGGKEAIFDHNVEIEKRIADIQGVLNKKKPTYIEYKNDKVTKEKSIQKYTELIEKEKKKIKKLESKKEHIDNIVLNKLNKNLDIESDILAKELRKEGLKSSNITLNVNIIELNREINKRKRKQTGIQELIQKWTDQIRIPKDQNIKQNIKNINDIEWEFVDMFGIPKIYKGTSVLKNYTEEKSDINETLPYEYVAIQEKFLTKEKYREDGKTKRYYVFFTSGSTEINKQEDIDKIANSIQERMMNKNAIINIRIIGQASHKWLTKKSDEHGKKLNEELANKRANIVKEALNKLLERHITHNEIDSTINIETMVSIADYDTANEIENNANLANLRSVIVEINTQ